MLTFESVSWSALMCRTLPSGNSFPICMLIIVLSLVVEV